MGSTQWDLNGDLFHGLSLDFIGYLMGFHQKKSDMMGLDPVAIS